MLYVLIGFLLTILGFFFMRQRWDFCVVPIVIGTMSLFIALFFYMANSENSKSMINKREAILITHDALSVGNELEQLTLDEQIIDFNNDLSYYKTFNGTLRDLGIDDSVEGIEYISACDLNK